MTDLVDELRLRLLERPLLDLATRPASVRFWLGNRWNLVSGIYLCGFGLVQLFGQIQGGHLFSLDLLLALGCLYASSILLKKQFNHYEISIGPKFVIFSHQWLRKTMVKWQVPLQQYQSIALNLIPIPFSRMAGFSVDLVHSDPQKSLPLYVTVNRSTAERQVQLFQTALHVPLVNQAESVTHLKPNVSPPSSAWQGWNQQSTDSLTKGWIIIVLGLFVLGTQDVSAMENMVLLGLLTLFAVRTILVVFMAWYIPALQQGQQFPFGDFARWPIEYKQLNNDRIQKRVQKYFQRERTRVGDLGFYDLWGVRLALPNYSVFHNVGLYCGLKFHNFPTQVQHPWRLTILQPVLAFPGEATYASISGRGIYFTTVFEDGTLLRTSTRKKVRAFNFVDTNAHIYSSSTGDSVEQTWKHHQSERQRLQALGETPCQEVGFEEFVNMDTRINTSTDEYDWYLIE